MKPNDDAKRFECIELVARHLRTDFTSVEIVSAHAALREFKTEELVAVVDLVLKNHPRNANIIEAFKREIKAMRNANMYQQHRPQRLVDGQDRERTQARIDATRRLRQQGIKLPPNAKVDEEIRRYQAELDGDSALKRSSVDSVEPTPSANVTSTASDVHGDTSTTSGSVTPVDPPWDPSTAPPFTDGATCEEQF